MEDFSDIKSHIINASICSKAVYSAPEKVLGEHEPETMFEDFAAWNDLTKSMNSHTIQKVLKIQTKNQQRFLFAIGQVSQVKTIYVSARGSAGVSDWIVNMTFQFATDSLTDMRFHKGFYNRATDLQPHVILKLAKEHQVDAIVLCGHSLGGAVTSVAALRLMALNREFRCLLPVYTITLGAPYFCSKISEFAQEHSSRFLHIVGDNDPVPTLLACNSVRKNLLMRLGVPKNLITGLEKLFNPLSGPIVKILNYRQESNDLTTFENLIFNVMRAFLQDDESSVTNFPHEEDFGPFGCFLLIAGDSDSDSFFTNFTEEESAMVRETLKVNARSVDIGDIGTEHSIDTYVREIQEKCQPNYFE